METEPSISGMGGKCWLLPCHKTVWMVPMQYQVCRYFVGVVVAFVLQSLTFIEFVENIILL